jgi:hypothetical protein
MRMIALLLVILSPQVVPSLVPAVAYPLPRPLPNLGTFFDCSGCRSSVVTHSGRYSDRENTTRCRERGVKGRGHGVRWQREILDSGRWALHNRSQIRGLQDQAAKEPSSQISLIRIPNCLCSNPTTTGTADNRLFSAAAVSQMTQEAFSSRRDQNENEIADRGCACVPVFLSVLESAERRFPAVRTALLALCCLFALVIPLSGQQEQTDPHSVNFIRTALSLQRQGIHMSFVDKNVARLGDETAITLLKIFTEAELSDPKTAAGFLPVIQQSFSQPQFISTDADNKPSMTIILLKYLQQNVSDVQTQRSIEGSIEDTIKYVAEKTASLEPPQAAISEAPQVSGFLRFGGPYQQIEVAASAMRPGDSDSIRAVVEEIVNYARYYRMPDVMAAIVKQRLIDAQRDYFAGKNAGAVDGAIVDAINALAIAFDTPGYARVSLLEVQFLRSRAVSAMPYLMRSAPDTKLGEADPPMSPLQAIWLMSLLIDQKIDNPDYQAIPADWDRDYYPKLLEKAQAFEDLRRRIAAGEVNTQSKYAFLVGGTPRSPELRFLLARRVREMSVADGLKLFNETFARLGIQ